jgi:hypothetical protein
MNAVALGIYHVSDARGDGRGCSANTIQARGGLGGLGGALGDFPGDVETMT